MGRLKLLKQVAAGLARQFGPDCEIVIHDLKTKDLEHSIVYLENGHVFGIRFSAHWISFIFLVPPFLCSHRYSYIKYIWKCRNNLPPCRLTW